MDELEDWEEWDRSKMPFMYHMIAGSFAGLAEHVTVFPIDTIKTNVQCQVCGATEPNQVWNCASRIVRHEGFFRLWRGVSAMFAGCIPAHAAYFSVYETSKSYLVLNNGSASSPPTHQPIRAAMCGGMASISHDLFMTPFDVVKQRMQLGHYKNIGHCVRSIVKSEGAIALYRSLPLTVMMNIPYGAIMVAMNESMRIALHPFLASSDGGGTVNMTTALFSGAVGGGTAAALTTPLDVVKTRLQTQQLAPCPKTPAVAPGSVISNSALAAAAPSPTASLELGGGSVRGVYSAVAAAAKEAVGTAPSVGSSNTSTESMMGHLRYRNAVQTIRVIVQEEGYWGLLRGVGPRMMTHAPAAGISWAVYEGMKNLLSKHA